MTWNALNLADLGQSFDTVLDCGLFHVLEDPDRPKCVEGLRTCMPADARYYMLCFSDLEPGDSVEPSHIRPGSSCRRR